MDRIQTMSRFEEPNNNDKPFLICYYNKCQEELYEGDMSYELEGDIYCSITCIVESLETNSILTKGIIKNENY